MQNKQIIPDGWMVRTVKQFGKVVSGGTPDTNNCSFWGGDIFWLTPSEVSSLQNRYIYRTKRTITKGGLDNSSAMLLPKNSLILCTRATIGDCCINAVEMCTNQGFKNIIVNKDNNVEFLYYLVLKNKNELLRKACGSTFLEISKKDVEKLKFVVPPLEEQKKIAQILAAWDSAIEQLTDLIAEKQHQKKALMQRLLTGKHRLPGFNKPWKKQLLNDLFKIYKGRDLSKNLVSISGKHKCILYGEIYTKYSEVIREVVSKTDADLGVPSISGDILVPASTTTQGIDLAKASVVLEDNVLLGGDINILRKKSELSSEFFSYALTNVYNFNIAKLTQGITIVHLYPEHLKGLVLYVPELSEQKAIADVLMAADAEIDLLQQQLQAITEQKQGLMQQLLTGNIRVKIDKKS